MAVKLTPEDELAMKQAAASKALKPAGSAVPPWAAGVAGADARLQAQPVAMAAPKPLAAPTLSAQPFAAAPATAAPASAPQLPTAPTAVVTAPQAPAPTTTPKPVAPPWEASVNAAQRALTNASKSVAAPAQSAPTPQAALNTASAAANNAAPGSVVPPWTLPANMPPVQTLAPQQTGFAPNDPGARANADATFRDVLPSVAAVKDQMSAGDLAASAAALSKAAGVGMPQAAENIQAIQGGRPAVNTASPTGLWQGTVSPDNIEGAPTSVIASTATPQQAATAADLARAAASQAASLAAGKPPVAIAGDNQAVVPGTAPVGNGTLSAQPVSITQDAPPGPAPAVGGNPAPAASAAPAPLGPATYLDLQNDPERLAQYQRIAQQALRAKYDPQALGIRQRLEQSRVGMDRNINDQQRQVLELANQRGLGLWGTTLNSQAQVAGRAVEQMTLDERQANERVEALRAAEANELNPLVQHLFENDRNFQEDVRRYGQDYAIRKATSDFALKRGESLLPYELTGAGLSNQTAALGLRRGEGLLPYELETAKLGTESRMLGNIGQVIGNNQARLNYGTAEQLQPTQITAAQLQQKAQQLEYDIANDPDVGSRAQKQAELDLVRSQIGASNALANQRGTSGDAAATKEAKTAFNAQVNDNLTKFNIGRPAAEVWTELVEMWNEEPADTNQKQADLLQAVGGRSGLSELDKGWLTLMFQSAEAGNQTAQESLNQPPYRKRSITE